MSGAPDIWSFGIFSLVVEGSAPRIFLDNPGNGSQLFINGYINFTINDTSSNVDEAWYSKDNGITNTVVLFTFFDKIAVQTRQVSIENVNILKVNEPYEYKQGGK